MTAYRWYASNGVKHPVVALDFRKLRMLNTSKTSMYRIYQKIWTRNPTRGRKESLIATWKKNFTTSKNYQEKAIGWRNELSQQHGTQKYISMNVWRLQKYRRCTCIKLRPYYISDTTRLTLNNNTLLACSLSLIFTLLHVTPGFKSTNNRGSDNSRLQYCNPLLFR